MLLDIQNLSFGWRKEALLENIAGRVRRGEIVQLVGDNGSGKTTLLHLISGMIPHFSRGELLQGEVLISGRSILKEPPQSFFPTLAFIPSLNLDFFLLTESLQQEMLLTTAILKIDTAQAEKRLAEFSNFFPSIQELIALPYQAMRLPQKILALNFIYYLQQAELYLIDEVFTGFAESMAQNWYSYFRWLSARNCGVIFVNHQQQVEGISRWLLADKKLVYR